VVSIYNDNFLTPLSRPQYFIEVYRCVQVDFAECSSSGPSGYPVPKQIGKIEIVVPDITKGKDRNSTNNELKFYKYVVYNHTSCKCGTLKFRDSTLYQTITNNEGKSNEHACFVINFLSIFRKFFPLFYWNSRKTCSYIYICTAWWYIYIYIYI
jgi:hypothetical protein